MRSATSSSLAGGRALAPLAAAGLAPAPFVAGAGVAAGFAAAGPAASAPTGPVVAPRGVAVGAGRLAACASVDGSRCRRTSKRLANRKRPPVRLLPYASQRQPGSPAARPCPPGRARCPAATGPAEARLAAIPPRSWAT